MSLYHRYSYIRFFIICLILLSGTIVLPDKVGAQVPGGSTSASGWNNMPLEEALVKFQQVTGTTLSYDPRLLTGKHTTSVIVTPASPEQLLASVLQGSGLQMYRLSTGSFAIRETPSDAPLSGSLVGFVLDRVTGEPLSNVHVMLEEWAAQGRVSSNNGIFAFPSITVGSYHLRVTHVGYDTYTDTLTIEPGVHQQLWVELNPKAIPLTITPLVVEGEHYSEYPHFLGNTLLDVSRLNSLGTSDPIRSLNTIHGIRVENGLAEVHIQGGESGEHQVHLDGVPIFEPVHLRGLLGAFSPFAIERVTAYKAGFSAAKGSYLSGVIEAEHALNDTDGEPFDIQFDPLSANGRLNLEMGNAQGVRSQFMAAVRTSLWDLHSPSRIDTLLTRWNAADPFIMRASLLPLRADYPNIYNRWVGRLDSIPPPGSPNVGFTDLHSALRLRFKEGQTFYASYYRGYNRLDNRRLVDAYINDIHGDPKNPDRNEWTNQSGQLRWSMLPEPNFFLTTRLRSSLYYLRHRYIAIDKTHTISLPLGPGIRSPLYLAPSDNNNRIRETALESTLDIGHQGGTAQLGVELIHTGLRFSMTNVFTRPLEIEDSSWRMAFFAQEKLQILPRLTLNAGTRLTYLGSHARFYPEPRLSLQYQHPKTVLGGVTVHLASGIYRQFLNQFDISTISPSTLFSYTRFWMPADTTMSPPRAYHLAGTVVWQPSNQWAINLESYYKAQPHLLRIDYARLWLPGIPEEDGSIPPITRQDGFLAPSKGKAYGGAVTLQRTTSKLRSALRYEYNNSQREYAFQDTVLTGNTPWNEPHLVELSLDWTPHPRFTATARWRVSWGKTWGFRQAYYNYFGSDKTQETIYGDFDFSNPQKHRLPSFQQLDVATAYTLPIGPTALQFRLDILNATDHNNVIDRSLVALEEEETRYLAQDRYLLPRMISLAVHVKW